MKSTSLIMNAPQRPITLFGLPPILIAITLFSAFTVFVVCNILQLTAVSMILGGVVFMIGVVLSWRAVRRDIHIESVMTLPTRFWKSRKNHTRILLAGKVD
jgi:hypothetical protein